MTFAEHLQAELAAAKAKVAEIEATIAHPLTQSWLERDIGEVKTFLASIESRLGL